MEEWEQFSSGLDSGQLFDFIGWITDVLHKHGKILNNDDIEKVNKIFEKMTEDEKEIIDKVLVSNYAGNIERMIIENMQKAFFNN